MDFGPQNIIPLHSHNACHAQRRVQKRNRHNSNCKTTRWVLFKFRSALSEDLEWETRAEDVALSLDAIKRCLSNILVALDRDTPQTKNGLALPLTFSTQELIMTQELPWFWFTLPGLGFPLLTDEYHRPIHPEIEKFMRKPRILGLDNRAHPRSDHTRHSHDSATIRTSKHERGTMTPSETHLNER